VQLIVYCLLFILFLFVIHFNVVDAPILTCNKIEWQVPSRRLGTSFLAYEQKTVATAGAGVDAGAGHLVLPHSVLEHFEVVEEIGRGVSGCRCSRVS
jgi:hypothetical protein